MTFFTDETMAVAAVLACIVVPSLIGMWVGFVSARAHQKDAR